MEQMQYIAKLGIDNSDLLAGIENMSQKFASFFTGATVGLAAVGAAAMAVTEEFWKMADAAHEMEEFSAATGTSTESLQKFQYAARLAGENTEWYNGTIQKLLTNMGRATDATSEQALAFQRLGVNPNGKSVDQVYVEVFEALQKVDDVNVRAQMSTQLLGRSWVEATIQGNHYIENLDKINDKAYFTKEEIAKMAENQARWNAMMADGNFEFQKITFKVYEFTEALSVQRKVFERLGDVAGAYYDKIMGIENLSKSTLDKGQTGFKNLSEMELAGNAKVQAEYDYIAGLPKPFISKSTGAAASVAEVNTYVSGSTGWDQGQVSPNNYFAAGVSPNLGVMGSPIQANAYQLSVAAGLYQKYYDQLTGDKWGQQQHREEIARQMAYNEAAAGFKSQDEAWAATGYNPTGNITIQVFSPITTAEAIDALSEQISRAMATHT